MNPTIISKSEIGTVLEALEKIKTKLISEDDIDSIDNITKLIECNLHNLEGPKFSAYNYEDFLFEFSQQIEGLRFISNAFENLSDVDVTNSSPILRAITCQLITCYNHFSKIRSILYATPFLLIESEIEKLDSIISEYVDSLSFYE